MGYIEGVIRNLTYYNEDNAYAVVKLTITDANIKRGLFDEDLDEVMTVTGYFPKPLKGDSYRFYGDIVHHPKYGDQFSAKSIERVSETNIEGLREYFSSDLFPGIGEKTANRIVDCLGKEAIAKIIKDADVLETVPKLTDAQKKVLISGLKEHRASEQMLIKLYGYGISSKMAMRIMNVYKSATLTKIESNPYQMIKDIEGIGFERADVIGKRLGFSEDHPSRLEALITHLFSDLVLSQGHTHIDSEDFINAAISKLDSDENTVQPDVLREALDKLIVAKTFVVVDGLLTLKRVDSAEQTIADKLDVLTKTTNAIDENKALKLIEAIEKEEAIDYSDFQKDAILKALTHQTMIVTGGPGTGKTTVIKGIIEVYYRYHNIAKPIKTQPSLIHLVAPTGRAAKRMEESTGYYAQTIHRFLGYAFDGTFEYNRYHQVEGNLFIIDEASMIDVFLAAQLLESLPDFANVIFVGDDAQLPSVGPGQVFKDIIDAQCLPVVALNVIHRQGKDSNIIRLAQHIRNGTLPSDLKKVYDDRVVFDEHPRNFQDRLQKIIDYMIAQGYTLQEDIQVLIPMYKGDVGIHETNRFIQSVYNQKPKAMMEHGDRSFRISDKVLQLVNQIEDKVMNGDQGKIVDILEDEVVVEFLDNRVSYKTKDLINITHAYAMSIHKAQGSEYKVVILPLFSSYSIMLKRKLIYTAITRAKERLVILGNIDKLDYAVSRLEESRNTQLDVKLKVKKPKMKRVDEPLPLKRGAEVEHKIEDSEIPFDTLGEPLEKKTPYDFLDES